MRAALLLAALAAPRFNAFRSTDCDPPLGTPTGCPSVYVYDLPDLWDLDVPFSRLKDLPPENHQIFGTPCRSDLPQEYSGSQFAAPIIVLWRLARSARCRLTTDPAKADLFIVPTWPKPKGSKDWEHVCKSSSNSNLERRLRHLNNDTAHRHLFLVGKGHVPHIKDRCDDWWRRPTGLLKRALRFAYSRDYNASDDDLKANSEYGPEILTPAEADLLAPDALFDDEAPFPHLVSIPYPSSIHYSYASYKASLRGQAPPPPWAARSTWHHGMDLASFVGSHHPTVNSFAQTRDPLMKDCDVAAANASLAEARGVKKACELMHYHNCHMRDSFSRSVFCFEPGGDSPYRKGIFDSLHAGCVPVVFGEYLDRVAPLHFGARTHGDVMVVLDKEAYMHRDFDLLEHLSKIPPKRVAQYQAAIAETAHHTHYAVDDFPGDAVERLLTGALDMARARAWATYYPNTKLR